MEFDYYQQEAQKTDQLPEQDAGGIARNDLTVPLLGLAGEAGELLSEYKKHLRDGEAHKFFKERVSEELGDLLWYIANLATKFDLKLSDVAQNNIDKTQGRWGEGNSAAIVFDADFPEGERLPRVFEVELSEVLVGSVRKARMTIDGVQIGDPLTDNADDADGYRFHDVFHLGYIAVLGWSPVIRKLMQRKRRSKPQIDEVQDGGRAQVIDEAVAALVFEYAKNHKWLNGVSALDDELLKTIQGLTSLLEVKKRSLSEWQRAILQGFDVWREIHKNEGGRILVDQNSRKLTFLGPVAGAVVA